MLTVGKVMTLKGDRIQCMIVSVSLSDTCYANQQKCNPECYIFEFLKPQGYHIELLALLR
jgi:hypothetical protein